MTKYNFQKVFRIFNNNYVSIPLEIFGNSPYKTLISTLLSSRTKDEVTLKASQRLFKKAPTINKLLTLKKIEIEKIIYPVGFYKTKASHLKKLAYIIQKDFQGRIPNTRKNLMSLPGVGRKTANLVINRVFNFPAIAVDTHVHRISNLLGWVKTKNPIDTEKELVKSVPKKYWKDLNRLFVSIGRQYKSTRKVEKSLESYNLIDKK